MKNIFTVCFLCFIGQLSSKEIDNCFQLIPQPQKIEIKNGKGLYYNELIFVIAEENSVIPVLGNLTGNLQQIKKKGKGIYLQLSNAAYLPESDEGYILEVNNNGILIQARNQKGLFYGCQTIEQLIEDSRDFSTRIPCMKITDYPVMAYRAVHFDTKHHLDRMEYYYRAIDRLARYKINAVIWEFEDKLRYQLQPLVGAPQSISIDEMAAFTRYARDRNIEVTPLVQGLGHATFILKHQEYAHLRELPWNRWAFCPLNEGTYQVLFDLYRDAIKATPGSKYLHIGGDEIGNIGLCPRCKPMADKEGMLSLNLYWLKRVCEFAKENGRIPIFWDDMPLQYAKVYESTWSDKVTSAEAAKAWEEGIPKLDYLLTDFPKNCVYMRWNYSMATQPGNIRALDWYKSRGLETMIATATNAQGGFMFQTDEREKGTASSGIITIKSFEELAADKKIGGVLCTAWDDKSPHMENFWRGFIASAEYSWSPNGRTLVEFDKAWLQREFGISMPDFTSFNNQLSKGSILWYEAFFRNGNLLGEDNALQSLVQLEHWLKPLEGREKRQFDYTTKLIELPDLNSPGSWSLKYKDRLDRCLIESDNYETLLARLTHLYNSSQRNRYYWSISKALYNLQITAPHILLALKKCDSADINTQKTGIENLKKSIKEFKQVWNDLQSVYGQTRFISNPNNGVPDRYFHLASQREDLSWMILAEELYLGMIEKWLPGITNL